MSLTVARVDPTLRASWQALRLHLVQTKPNSIMMVGAGLSGASLVCQVSVEDTDLQPCLGVNAATHCVSSTDGGTRTILKFIYVLGCTGQGHILQHVLICLPCVGGYDTAR